MSIKPLVNALHRGNKAFAALADQSYDNLNLAKQIVRLTHDFGELAKQLTFRMLTLPSDDIDECLEEVLQACEAAEAANGKNEPERAMAVVEGNEAVQLILLRATMTAAAMARVPYGANLAYRLPGTPTLPGGLTPSPRPEPELPLPRWPLPPRPLPSWPWPLPPLPWPPFPCPPPLPWWHHDDTGMMGSGLTSWK